MGLFTTFRNAMRGADPDADALTQRHIDYIRMFNENHGNAKTAGVAERVVMFGVAAADLNPATRQQKTQAFLGALEAAGFKPYTEKSADDRSYVPLQITDPRQQAAYKIIGMAMSQLQEKGAIAGNTGMSLRLIAETPKASAPAI